MVKVEIKDNHTEVSKRAARLVSRELLAREEPVLGLPTGNTPKRMYEFLVEYYEAGLVDFSRTRTFNLDEYYPISGDDPRSFRSYMEERLFERVNLREENVHLLDGEVPEEEVSSHCSEYEEKIVETGGIDLMVLGIGENGHIGFNEPGVDFGTGSRLVELQEETIRRNFEDPASAPDKALSMGITTITRSRKILLLASGEEKADAIGEAISGPVAEECPASVLQLHPDVTFLLDGEAGEKIGSEFKRGDRGR